MTKLLNNSLEKVKSLFSRKQKRNLDNSGNSNLRKVLGKISGAFMLPISIMAISGLWLGVGSAIASNAGGNEALRTFGIFIQMLGDPVFSFLPLLFAIAFVIAFTDDAGVAVFATVIGFATFLAIQSVFIKDVYTNETFNYENTNNVVYLISTKDANFNNVSYEVFVHNNVAYQVQNIPGQDAAVVPFKLNNSAVDVMVKDGTTHFSVNGIALTSTIKQMHGYNILFSGAGRDPLLLEKLVGKSLGITSLQTSVFGGIAIGLLVQYLYNRFHTIQLPGVISFFAGKRFVAIITVPFAALMAFIFLILWPWVGYALSVFGNSLGKIPYGFESLIFGFIERSLVPFGLHHVFYSPLWYSDAGGSLNYSLGEWVKTLSPEAVNELMTNPVYQDLRNLLNIVAAEPNKFVGDSTMSVNILKLNFNTIVYPVVVDGKVSASQATPIFHFIADQLGIKAGRFADGKFSFMMFGLPAAALAMVFAAPKENRKVALSAVLPSAITTIVTGVTEPIEFTFLFLSPFLFWGFHAFFAGISFMLANLLGVHIPMIFSGGLLDLTIYGIVPLAKGTNFYWTFVVGLFYAPLYFGFFYFWIKYKDLKTPGRGDTVKLFTKADYLKGKNKSNKNELDPQTIAIVEGFGGVDNITAFNNCASRLRYDIKDMNLVNEDKLKAAGAVAIKREGSNHVQAIFGPAAEQINIKIRNSREALAKLTANSSMEGSSMSENLQSNNQAQKQTNNNKLATPVLINSVANGDLIKLEDVNDGVFSAKMMGEGFAVEFKDSNIGEVYAPVDGTLSVVFETKHAYGIETAEGVQVLVHIGIDTVTLNGQGFENFVKVGDTVKKGDLLAKVDLNFLKEKNIKSSPIVVVLNESTHKDLTFVKQPSSVSTSDTVLEVR
ncbi:PTS transporter subunit IIABC [Mycoplasmopsis columboralis]|uniref:PTS system, glucose/glucosamine/beta-glucoside-specific, IICBA component n=1 Tax=Mycoplasmopsis columboralis TaxID=171282 RepID=A0A449B5K5_9BACT|nr:PTS transporter subunit IIABC [Mycoplasmopsis columboralis]VEU75887.1 PTS system, glucose/glucosamine/beta-glucoside-specific, IICBA component [Mycoplasmopsis columboralis]